MDEREGEIAEFENLFSELESNGDPLTRESLLNLRIAIDRFYGRNVPTSEPLPSYWYQEVTAHGYARRSIDHSV